MTTMTEPKILIYDVERAPATFVAWGTGKTNLTLKQMLTPGYIIGTGYMWYGDEKASWTTSIKRVWELFNKADVLTGYNSNSFDEKHLNREFAQAGLKRPAPSQRIDLLRSARKAFAGESHKLDYYAQQFLGDQKTETGGMDLWLACMRGERQALNKMRAYCLKDVELTRDLYTYLRDGGWIDSVNWANLNGTPNACPTCGETRVARIGVAHTKQGTMQRWRCRSMHYFRTTKRINGANTAHIS